MFDIHTTRLRGANILAFELAYAILQGKKIWEVYLEENTKVWVINI